MIWENWENTLFYSIFSSKNLCALNLKLPNNATLKFKTIPSVSNPVLYTAFSLCDRWRVKRMIISYYNSLRLDVVKKNAEISVLNREKEKSYSDHIWQLEKCTLGNQQVGKVISSILHILEIMPFLKRCIKEWQTT